MIRFGSDAWIMFNYLFVSSLLLIYSLSICLYVHLDVIVLIRKYHGSAATGCLFTFFFMEPQEWETSKENVLPLRQGRSANTLNQALQNGTPQRNPVVEKKIRFARAYRLNLVSSSRALSIIWEVIPWRPGFRREPSF